MKILIIGLLGAGKSSLAYAINKKYGLPRLNLDEVRRTKDGGYRDKEGQWILLDDFLKKNQFWVMEGCQKDLYEKVEPDLIVDMRINRLVATWRFTTRFLKAKKLIGEDISPDLPVQAYHYRKITPCKIWEWNATNKRLNEEMTNFLKNKEIPVLTCKRFKDYQKIFEYIEKTGKIKSV